MQQTNNKKYWVAGALVLVIIGILGWNFTNNKSKSVYKIGWISDMTGPQAKYGAYEAGKLAMEQINANGGINGKPLEIIFENGKCNGTQAVSAMNKLINIS